MCEYQQSIRGVDKVIKNMASIKQEESILRKKSFFLSHFSET